MQCISHVWLQQVDGAEGSSDDRPERLSGDKAKEGEEGEDDTAHTLGRTASLNLIPKAVADDE